MTDFFYYLTALWQLIALGIFCFIVLLMVLVTIYQAVKHDKVFTIEGGLK